MMSVMKPQLASGVRSVSVSYGDILYRVWREANPDMAASSEEIIQTFVHEGIHAANPKYFRSIRLVLKAFHDAKQKKGVDSMLVRVYGPILWRSLRCANATVRAQAATILFDAFPLQSEDSTAAEQDALMQKQFDLFVSLLKDPDHRVRAAVASGVCHVLREYWELIPQVTTRQAMTYIVGTLGQDSASADVRLAVMTGLKEMLNQPLAHPVLKGLLPVLSNCVHDQSEKVRVAFIQILVKLKKTRGIAYYDIVSADQLMLRLGADARKSSVCLAISQLLLSTIYPTKAGAKKRKNKKAVAEDDGAAEEILGSLESEQMIRCLDLVQKAPEAAVAFYAHFYKHAGAGAAVKMALMVLSLFTELEQAEDGGKLSIETVRPVADTATATSKGEKKRSKKRAHSKEGENGAEEEDIPSKGELETVAVEYLLTAESQFSLLRIVLVCLASVSKLLEKESNTGLVDAIRENIDSEIISTTFSTVLSMVGSSIVPSAVGIFLQIIAEVDHIAGEMSSSVGFFDSVLHVYLQAHATKEDSTSLAMTIARVAGSAGFREELYNEILESCNAFCSLSASPQKDVLKKRRGGKQTNPATKLPKEAAVELLAAAAHQILNTDPETTMVDQATENLFTQVFGVFRSLIDAHCTETFSSTNTLSELDCALACRAIHICGMVFMHMQLGSESEETPAGVSTIDTPMKAPENRSLSRSGFVEMLEWFTSSVASRIDASIDSASSMPLESPQVTSPMRSRQRINTPGDVPAEDVAVGSTRSSIMLTLFHSMSALVCDFLAFNTPCAELTQALLQLSTALPSMIERNPANKMLVLSVSRLVYRVAVSPDCFSSVPLRNTIFERMVKCLSKGVLQEVYDDDSGAYARTITMALEQMIKVDAVPEAIIKVVVDVVLRCVVAAEMSTEDFMSVLEKEEPVGAENVAKSLTTALLQTKSATTSRVIHVLSSKCHASSGDGSRDPAAVVLRALVEIGSERLQPNDLAFALSELRIAGGAEGTDAEASDENTKGSAKTAHPEGDTENRPAPVNASDVQMRLTESDQKAHEGIGTKNALSPTPAAPMRSPGITL
jgi:hypothetical protein